LVDFISTHSFLVFLFVCLCVCVYFILTVFVLIWAKLPDIKKWMDRWIRPRVLFICYVKSYSRYKNKGKVKYNRSTVYTQDNTEHKTIC